jgi:proteasome lid subunit RPN8/RPN11
MKSNKVPSVSSWRLARSVLPDSLAEMKRDGLRGNEGIVLWLGHKGNGLAEVTHLVSLRGSGISKSPVNLTIDAWLINDVTDIALQLGVRLIGQIHSHGPGFGTDLSYSDRSYGVAVPGYLSVVAPDYALRPSTLWSDCGVFVYEKGIGYKRLRIREFKQRFQFIATCKPPMLVVGEESQ